MVSCLIVGTVLAQQSGEAVSLDDSRMNDSDYMSWKEFMIKGINYSKDFLMQIFSAFLGQLMVATFLFYSGYGIYYQITHKGDNYIKSMPLKRIIAFICFLFLFVIIGIIIDVIAPIIKSDTLKGNN